MAKKRKATPRKSQRNSRKRVRSKQSLDDQLGGLRPGLLVRYRSGEASNAIESITQATGLHNVAMSSDFPGSDPSELLSAKTEVKIFERLGIAVVDADEHQSESLSAASGDALAIVEPEPIFLASSDPRLDYLCGFRDAADQIYTVFSKGIERLPSESIISAAPREDTSSFTWGLYETGVNLSPLSGKGVKVAVLDTGFDMDHPDFQGRTVIAKSFILGESVQDENGHGTHCVGTACGPRAPQSGRGYGIAYESEIYVGKVLSNRGASLGRSTLAGIEWAIEQGVDIVSMSLGGMVYPGEPYSQVFEDVGQAANEEGLLLVAAAGNDSRRGAGQYIPVNSPANCPSFLAISALDSSLQVADFSNRGINLGGGEIDLSGPGVKVYSSAPEPAPPRQPPYYRQWRGRNDTISGTSMATPHVAGIAALWKQAEPQANPERLRRLLRESARRLELPAEDAGSGLVQAPQNNPNDRSARIRVIG